RRKRRSPHRGAFRGGGLLLPCSFARTGALRENVVVAGGGVVLLDDGRRVEGERPVVIHAAAHAVAVAAPGPSVTAEGQVDFDRAVAGRGTRPGGNGETASQPISAVATRERAAALSQVAVQRAVADGHGRIVRLTQEDA